MKRSLRLAALVGMFTCATVIGRADEPATTIRLWHVGNSWSCPFPFETVGRFERPFILHTHRFNGGTGPNWLDQALETDKKRVLEQGDYEAVYLGFVQLAQSRGAKGGKPPVTEAAHAALQKLAWEVVSAYPYSGVPAADGSKPAVAAPAPTP